MPTPDGPPAYTPQTFQQAMLPEAPRQPQHALSMMTTATTSVIGNCDESGNRVINGYVLQQRLGSGSFATVFKGLKVLDASGNVETVAVKVIARDDKKLTKKVLENLEMEIAILRSYRHPNIVCLHNVQKTERNFYLLLEYCSGGDVQHLIRSRQTGRLSERLTRRLLRDLASGLKFLWGQELIHRDLKPQNLLLTGALPLDELNDPAKTVEEEEARRRVNFPTAKFALKIADFGFARHLQSASLAETLCGSPLYMAPEILQHNRYDAKADLWSVGTVLFEMIAGHPPFHGENHIDLLRNIQRKAVRLPPDVRVSRECVNLLRILLNRNPLTRAGFKEFFEAADAFVGLGCEGQPLTDLPSTTSTPLPLHGHLNPLVNLVPISEDDEASGSGHHGTMASPPVSETFSNPGQVHQHRDQHNTMQANYDTPMLAEGAVDRQVGVVPSPSPVPRHTGFGSHHGNPMHPVQHTFPMTAQPAPSPTQGLENRPSAPMQAARHPQFLPLVPSPPGPRVLAGIDIHSQAPFSLDGETSQAMVSRTVTSVPYATEDLQHRSDSLQASEDAGYVMVERAVTISPASSQVIRPQDETFRRQQQQYHGLTPANLQGRGTRLGATPTQTQTSFQRGNVGSFQPHEVGRMGMMRNLLSRGILSTSPGSGRAIVGGGAGGTMRGGEGVTNSVVSPAQGYGTAMQVLSTAEDVGRRAVSVAHLGDTRAFIAVRLLLDGGTTSTLVPMEGVVEDDAAEGEDETIQAAHLSEIGGSPPVPQRRRSVSSDLSSQVQSRMGSIKVEKDDDDDEMPFALEEVPVDATPSTAPIIMQRAIITSGAVGATVDSVAVPRSRPRPSNALILAHFKEALSCYVKALSMLKGAVSAAQKVVSDVNRLVPSRMDSGHLESLKKRAQVSHGWLSGQFRGVLERADAANSEIAKLDGPKPEESQTDSPLSASTVVVSAEELIYNHCLSCGKDGAVKQLLGQHEAARSSYRSAGLLAETLLMEPRVGDEDRKVLEDYVRGFAERITELDNMLMRQSGTVSVTSSTVTPPVLGASTNLGSSRRVVTTGSRAVPKEMS